jgi:hypothetical protein
MRLTIVRFVFMMCACLALVGIIDMCLVKPTGYDLLFRFLSLCMAVFLCAHYYDYMDFNHPSKNP